MQKQEGSAGHVRVCLLRGWEVQEHGKFLLQRLLILQLLDLRIKVKRSDSTPDPFLKGSSGGASSPFLPSSEHLP